MKMRMLKTDYEWVQANPMIWWAPYARAKFSRVSPGIPATEMTVDSEGVETETGYVVLAHPDIDEFDNYILAVILKGKEYTDDIEDEDTRLGTIYARAIADLDAFTALGELYDTGGISRDQAIVQMQAVAMAVGDSLGVPRPPEPPSEDELLEVLPE